MTTDRMPIEEARRLWRAQLTGREITFTEDVDGLPLGAESSDPLPYHYTAASLGYTEDELSADEDDDQPDDAA